MNKLWRRREFMRFLGYGALGTNGALALAELATVGLSSTMANHQIVRGIEPSGVDELLLAEGFDWSFLIKWRDPISAGHRFGFNNDYIALISQDEGDALLWVNHESVVPVLVAGTERTKEAVDIERSEVGGTLLKIRNIDGRWLPVVGHPGNFRIDATTRIPFAGGHVVQDARFAEGTVANCAGGVTPWETILTCEENYHECYGEREFWTGVIGVSKLGWEKYYNNPPEHYGWVVEVDPSTGSSKKHVTLGRFAHESATCVLDQKGNAVVYSGDDKNDGCLYKFVADEPGSLESGTLYVADVVAGRWLPLDWSLHPVLREHFTNQTEVLTYAREAAVLLGGTPLARPEDVEINPITGDVYVAMTNNKPKGDFHGYILKLSERGKNYGALEFNAARFLTGGSDGFTCPDNLAFDRQGNLWFCSDVSGYAIGKDPYQSFGNNGLFLVPARGPQAGEVIQIGSAPIEAEFTGLCFDQPQRTLFLSVQHPGELTKDLDNPSSTWPHQTKLPMNAVVQISGSRLAQVTGGKMEPDRLSDAYCKKDYVAPRY